ncbi:Fungal Zn2-Cys6 binuclear cluster domain-containing protein [Cladophialophora immunda]|nr:Fungal Zn2-Cys6 binuclear cluster domain-containing protein [Cladophialophora immunda]
MQTFHPPNDGKGNGRSACDRCRRHKLRCERPSDSAQCRRCWKANVECVTGAALKSGRPSSRRQPSDALENWPLHQTLQTPSDTPETDSSTGREMQLPPAPITVDGLENGWPDGLQQDIDASQTFQPLSDTYQPVYSQIDPQGDCLKRLGDLQREIHVDLELVKACKTATDCAQLSLPPELAYNSSFLVGRMLEHSKTLLGILASFGSISPAPNCSTNVDYFPAVPTCPGGLHCDVPTMFSLFSCYICLIRIYRTIFSCIHDSMPVLLSLQPTLPQLFPGINLAGFTLETRLDLQVQILVQVSEDMLAKLEARLGVPEGATAGQGILEPTRAARMLSMMLEEEAHEQPPLYEPRGPCKSLRDILADLKRMINAENTNRRDIGV